MIDEFAKKYLHNDLRDARATMLWKLEGLGEYDVRRPMTPTGTNLLGLVKHLTITEAWYFGEAFGRPFPERLPWQDNDADARGDDAKLAALIDHKLQVADMWATQHESRVEIIDRYQRMCAHSDATIAALDIDAPGYVAWWPRPHVKLFNILVGVVSETCRHAGHADILRGSWTARWEPAQRTQSCMRETGPSGRTTTRRSNGRREQPIPLEPEDRAHRTAERVGVAAGDHVEVLCARP